MFQVFQVSEDGQVPGVQQVPRVIVPIVQMVFLDHAVQKASPVEQDVLVLTVLMGLLELKVCQVFKVLMAQWVLQAER